MGGTPGPPEPGQLICKSHEVEFSVITMSNVIADLWPDGFITLDTLNNQLDYCLNIINSTDSTVTIKYQVDYDYADSTF